MFNDEQEPTIEEFRANTIFKLYKVFGFDQGTMGMESILGMNVSFASILEKYGMDKMTSEEYHEYLVHMHQMNECANNEEFDRAENEGKILATTIVNILEIDELSTVNKLLDSFEENGDEDLNSN